MEEAPRKSAGYGEIFPRRPTRIEAPQEYIPIPPQIDPETGVDNPPTLERERLSGPLGERPEASRVPYAFYLVIDSSFENTGSIVGATYSPVVYESINGAWEVRATLNPDDILGNIEGEEAKIGNSYDSIGWVYTCTDNGKRFEGFKHGWFQLQSVGLGAISKLGSAGLAQLRSSLSSQFGIQLRSAGKSAVSGAITRIIFQTLDASPNNPYLVSFDQHILDPFTGPSGQFDLVERDARRRVFDGASTGNTAVLTSTTMNWQPSDVSGLIKVGTTTGRYYGILSRQSSSGITLSTDITLPSTGLTLTMDGATESEVTIATTGGYVDGTTVGGWSQFRKAITVDKVYKVVFVPGDAGDGIYSINCKGLYPVPPDQTPPTS